MAPDPKQPPFATFLLPSISFPNERSRSYVATTSDYPAERSRQLSTTSITSVPELSSSPTSTPSSSPPAVTFIPPSASYTAKQSLEDALRSLNYVPPFNNVNMKPNAAANDIEVLSEPRLGITQPNVLRCIGCTTDIAFTSQIVSKGFTGRHGRAYLVSPKLSHSSSATELSNLRVGRNVNRELLTGQHVVADVSCLVCGSVLGWKYVDAKEAAQRYKIGKVILEMKRVVIGVGWEDVTRDHASQVMGEYERIVEDADETVVFDSDDEDECEDLFAGTWDAETVRKRRARKVGGWKKLVRDAILED